MTFRAILVLLFVLGATWPAAGQATDALTVVFQPEYNGIPLQLETRAYPHGGGSDSLRITRFRSYISKLRLLHNGAVVWEETSSYHLIDAEDPQRLQLLLQIPRGLQFDALQFNPGIDSLTNAKGAQGGDLDATKGMYWAWQSGYVNLKLEGTSPSCATRHNEFQYHLGGFRGSDYALQTVTLPVRSAGTIHIRIDLAELLRAADLRTEPQIMIPGPSAVRLSAAAAAMFKPGAP